MQVTGYAYDADTHCVACALARFGADANGWIPEGVADSEGNDPGALFSTSESDTPGSCGTCGDAIEITLTSEGERYVREMVTDGRGGDWRERFAYLFDVPHQWQRGRFTGALTCARCGLLPLDDDDAETNCEG